MPTATAWSPRLRSAEAGIDLAGADLQKTNPQAGGDRLTATIVLTALQAYLATAEPP